MLQRTIHELRRAARSHHAAVWHSVAERLERSRHQVDPLNVGELERLAKADETLVVPGKLLAAGSIAKPVTVAAFSYSEAARAKIHAAGGKALTISELLRADPKGRGVRIVA